MYPVLPEQFTPAVLKALSLKQLGFVFARFGFVQTYKRLGMDDVIDVWQRECPSENFGGFLREAGVPMKGN